MRIEVRLPQLGDAISVARLTVWLKKDGDAVAAGEPLVEFETDKTTVEVEAPASGVLENIRIPDGTDGVPVGAILAMIVDGVPKELVRPSAVPLISPAPRVNMDVPDLATVNDVRSVSEDPAPVPEMLDPSSGEHGHGRTIRATSLALKMATLAGLDLESVRPIEPDGCITKADVDAALAQRQPPRADASHARAASPRETQPAITGGFRDEPLSLVRRTTAARLQQAKQTIPHFYLQADCRVDGLLQLQSKVNERLKDLKISVTALVIFAAAHALKKVPRANSSWIEGGLRIFDDVDIAVAVNTAQGLIVPILRKAQTKPLLTLSQELKELAGRARAGTLRPGEYTGGTFTISNLGMYEVTSIVPIVNPPHACILGVGGIERRPVVVGEAVTVGSVMSCTLAADHRAIDGATGAELLAELRRLLEDPVALTLDI